MKERPIIFSGDSVRAILAGKKSQTRRIVKAPKCATVHGRESLPDKHFADGIASNVGEYIHWAYTAGDLGSEVLMSRVGCVHEVDDRLWVKESFFADPPINGWDGDFEWNGCGRPLKGVPEQYRSPEHCLYRESWTGIELKWTSPLFMPRWASRLLLEVDNVRVERLQSITEDDAIAEGVDEISIHSVPRNATFCRRDDFAHLWDILNRKRASWDSNPWVWVVQFKRVEVVR